MKMYLPFGDWSDDGHGKYEKVLIDAPSMQQIRNAQIGVEEKYGKDIWDGYAECYQEPYLSDKVKEALIEAEYPASRFSQYQDDINFDKFDSLEDIFNSDYFNNKYEGYVTLNVVIDTFIWLLNYHGALIKRLDEKDEIPTICNWTCHGFETVGYGCFD